MKNQHTFIMIFNHIQKSPLNLNAEGITLKEIFGMIEE
jgi:hypothetical protein